MKNFILQNENAIYYECGYSCDNVIYLSLGTETFFITDSRYKIDAKQHLNKNCQLIIENNLIKATKKVLKNSKIKKINFDPNDFNLSDYLNLTSKLKIKFIEKPNFSKLKRIIKSDCEIELIRKAMILARDGFNEFQKYLKTNGVGKSEKHLAYIAQSFLSKYGKYKLSFDPIIAINDNSAKPHAMPSSTTYKQNDLTLFDGGIKYKRYCSDRTVTFGNNLENVQETQRDQKFKNKFKQKIYDIVLKAQEQTIKKARVGMKASKIDNIGRQIIEKAGYGKYFVHSTGHGVGLDIHEYPNISSRSDVVIEENMVYTVEPGIYLPNGFGVRIEDTIVMRSAKGEIL
jgi:Xaa-Pro aminopeptidase